MTLLESNWLSNARVVDVHTGAISQPTNVEIIEGKIGQITEKLPFGVRGNDCMGYFLLPGLISVHSHLSVTYPFSKTNVSENPAITVLRALSRAQDSLASGVTTVRSVHELNRVDIFLRSAFGDPKLRIPRIFAAGKAIGTTGGHGSESGGSRADGYDEFLKTARNELGLGADHIKVFISGGIGDAHESMSGAQMTMEEMNAVVRATIEHDTYVVAHAANALAIDQGLTAGIRSFEHAYELSDDVAKRMAEKNVFLTPTLCVTRCPEWMHDHDFTPEQIVRAMEVGPGHLESIRRAIRAGVQIVSGTDYPPGEAIEDTFVAVKEMEFLVEAGLSPLQALQAGTSLAAKLLNAENLIGSVQVGHAADLIAVKKDPTSNISALRNVDFVMSAGRIIRNEIR
jgi:imidazolonepropionase-like amidohydrolase